jgi:CDP-diglyceride synthetase
MKPVKTSVTFAVTAMLFYALCALIWFVFPEPFMQFMNSLFHGTDFHRLRSEPATLGGTIYADVILGIWAFLAAMFFSWLNRAFASARLGPLGRKHCRVRQVRP